MLCGTRTLLSFYCQRDYTDFAVLLPLLYLKYCGSVRWVMAVGMAVRFFVALAAMLLPLLLPLSLPRCLLGVGAGVAVEQ